MGQIQDQIHQRKGRLQEPLGRLQDEAFDLKKHVATIHSANHLSLVQRKIANALLFNAYNDLMSQSEFTIHIADLCHLIGYNSNEHRAIKDALMRLISTVIEWNLVDKQKLETEGQWNASAIIADASIKGAICTYSYSNRMRQLLHSPDMYGRVNMKIQAQFKSSYGLALYENCIRYQTIEKTPWFDILVFRQLMGVSETKYAAFKDFRKRVIDIAVKEVNQHTEFDVDYVLRKAGRKVVAIQFSITKAMTTNDSSLSLANRLVQDFGFSAKQATALIDQYSAEDIEQKIQLVLASNSYRQGRIVNMANYLKTALAENYQSPKSSHSVPEAVRQQQDLKQQEQQATLTQQRTLEKARRQTLLNSYAALPLEKRQQLLADYQQSIKDTFYLPLFLKDGITNAVVENHFLQFLLEQGELT